MKHFLQVTLIFSHAMACGICVVLFSLSGCGGGSSSNNLISLAPVDNTEAGSSDSTINLSWELPEYRQDGSRLDASEVFGYKLYAGNSADNLDRQYWISDPYQTSIQITNNVMKTTYIAIAVVDIYGLSSDLSPIKAFNSVQ